MTAVERTLLRAAWLVPEAGAAPVPDAALRVAGDRIEATGPAAALDAASGGERVVDLGDAIIVPGLVNAHQHGRGLSQLALGYPDDALEPWIAGRRRHGSPDVHALTRLAAEAMLAAGVTTTLHANYSYGSGDYEGELRATAEAYRDAGLRATICVGYQDRGAFIYPDADQAAFVAQLPEGVRTRLQSSAQAYMPDPDATLALMDRMIRLYAGNPLVSWAYGPAGPQWVSDAAWARLARDAAERDLGLHFHFLESPAQARANRQLYPEGTLRRLKALGVFAARTSFAHAVHATEDDLRVAAEHGAVLVTNPGSNMRLRNGVPPVADFLRSGVAVALGTDNTALADNEDYLLELRLGGLLARAQSGSPEPGPHALLAMATTDGARAAFLPDGHGTLRPGAAADLAAFALPADPPVEPLAQLLTSGSSVECRLTMVAGEIRFSGSEADRKRLDEARAAALAAAEAREAAWSAEEVASLQEALRRHYGYPAPQ